ncbi:MAG TPA: hypothetical protein PLZ78_08910 [Spirochaetota bacterium]|nr:hypothetical protein [Spirochaetota bacterium]
MIEIFSRLKAWFASLEIGKIAFSMFNRTYKNELYIVCGSIESLYQYKHGRAVIKRLKGIVGKEMARKKLDARFDRFLVRKGLMKTKGGKNGVQGKTAI